MFGKYGAIRQIRLGTTKKTRGTALVVYEDIFDAKRAQEHLNGYAVGSSYLVLVYHNPKKFRNRGKSKEQRKAELARMKEALKSTE